MVVHTHWRSDRNWKDLADYNEVSSKSHEPAAGFDDQLSSSSLQTKWESHRRTNSYVASIVAMISATGHARRW